jgi:phosphatidylglycerol---prolipoprotein diacylglyceryl transferase
MLQEVYRFSIGGWQFPIYGYGLMLVAAFLACVAVGKRLARHSGIDPELIVNAALIALVSGLIGARLCHVLENLSEFTRRDQTLWQNLGKLADIRGGGLTFYGGFLLATPCCIVYARMNRVPIRLGMDIIAPVLMIGLGLGRIGCFLNGCCYGEQCASALGVRFPYYSNAYIDQFERRQITPPAALLRGGMGLQALLPPDSPEFRSSPAAQAAARSALALPVLPTQLYSAFTAFLLAGLLVAY